MSTKMQDLERDVWQASLTGEDVLEKGTASAETTSPKQFQRGVRRAERSAVPRSTVLLRADPLRSADRAGCPEAVLGEPR